MSILCDSDDDKPTKKKQVAGYGLKKIKVNEQGVMIKNYKKFNDKNLVSQE